MDGVMTDRIVPHPEEEPVEPRRAHEDDEEHRESDEELEEEVLPMR